MNLIVYFHGYGSSANTDKVTRLKEMYPNDQVLAFDINIDPKISLPYLTEKIMDELIKYFNVPGDLYFVGTSLGAWYANELSNTFGCKALLINPCIDPETSIAKYGVEEKVRTHYSKANLKDLKRKMIALDPKDDVIDHKNLLNEVNADFQIYENVGHRFNGPEFEDVVKKFII